jgi:MFS family permease
MVHARLLIGAGAGAVSTVATLFIVDFAPNVEWEQRIGWLQSVNGAGQVAGLLIGGFAARGDFIAGFMLGAGLALVAILVGGIGLPLHGKTQMGSHPLHLLPMLPLLRPTQLGPGLVGLLHQSYHLQRAAFLGLYQGLRGPFGRLLLAWSAYNLGVSAFFAYYPLIMRQSFGIPPPVTAITYAASAGIGIFLFVAASRAAVRYGGRIVFQTGLAIRLIGFVLLAVPFHVVLPGESAIAISGFLLVTLSWPVLSVSGTALAARLTPISEGAAIGLLNASGAFATVAGTFITGPLVHAWGYAIVPLLAVGGLLIAELLMLGNRSRPVPSTEPGRSN